MGPVRVVAALVAAICCLAVASPALADPPGANDWACRPTAAHPRPVVLVHGTFENQTDNWGALSPTLKAAGYCVFALDYGDSGTGRLGVYGTAPVRQSAGELAAFVDRVLSATGAGQVDIVGHSQGGMMPRIYIQDLGGAAKVHALVGLSPSNHGTTASGVLTLAALIPGGSAAVAQSCPACADQTVGSPFITALNAEGDTVPGVAYTVIETKYDEVVTPYTSAFLSGATNITLQDGCPLDTSEHLSTPYDPRALQFVLNALDPSTAKTPPCGPFTLRSR